MSPLTRSLAAALCLALAQPAAAETVTSRAGASAQVSSGSARKFRALIAGLEAHGAVIKFMGGYRAGSCGQASKHSCGLALDVCQLARGVVDARCRLPGPKIENEVAIAAGLFPGALWCDGDRGHFEDGGSTACGHRWAARRRPWFTAASTEGWATTTGGGWRR